MIDWPAIYLNTTQRRATERAVATLGLPTRLGIVLLDPWDEEDEEEERRREEEDDDE